MAKKQKLPDLAQQDPLEPIDITSLGSSKDPCFGKGYNLATKECKMCGDSELCAFKMSQTLNISRKELEDKNHYKDLDMLEDIAGIKKYLRARIRKGDDRMEAVKKASIKFEVPKKDIRKIYKQLKNE